MCRMYPYTLSVPSLQPTTELIQHGGFAFLRNIGTNKHKNDHWNNSRPENLELATCQSLEFLTRLSVFLPSLVLLMIIKITAISSYVIRPEMSSSSFSSSSSSSSSITLSPLQALGCISHIRNAFLSFASPVQSCKVSCSFRGKEFYILVLWTVTTCNLVGDNTSQKTAASVNFRFM